MKKAIFVLTLCVLMPAATFGDMITFSYAIAGDGTLTSHWAGYNPTVIVDNFEWGTDPLGSNAVNPFGWTYNVDPDNNGAILRGPTTYSSASPPAINYGALTGQKDPTKYFTVPKTLDTTDPKINSSMITFGADYDYLGLFWGSVDTYNTIEFYDEGVLVATYTGSQVIFPSQANGNQLAPYSNLYVNFIDMTPFDAIRITSTQYAFEFDNLAVGCNVPVPGAVLLGFLGLSAAGLKLRRFA